MGRSSSSKRTTAEHPNRTEVEHDLADGDLEIGPLGVARSDALLIAVHSKDDAAFSVSVKWRDGNGNVYQTEPKGETGVSSSTDDWARLTRKGPQAVVTITNESGGENVVNAFVDTEP
jgi:hypothetical protein